MLDARLLAGGEGSSTHHASSSSGSIERRGALTRLAVGVVCCCLLAAIVVLVSLAATRRSAGSPHSSNGTSPVTPSELTSGWRQAGGDSQHTAVSNHSWLPASSRAAAANNVSLGLRWNFTAPHSFGTCGGGLVSDSGGRLYFTCAPVQSKSYFLYCMDASTGRVQWLTEHMEPYYSTQGWTPALSDDERLVFVRSASLQAFSAHNGSLVWQQPFDVTGDSLRVAPVVRGDVLYVNGKGGVEAYRASTGALLWRSAAIANTGPVSRSVTPALTPTGSVVLSAVQQQFNASRDHGPNPRLHLLASSTRAGATLWSWNVSLSFDQAASSSSDALSVQYAMSYELSGRELFYLNVFPYGLLVVDAATGTVVSWGQHNATLQAVGVSPVLWPAHAPNNPYGQPVVLHFVQTGTCYWTTRPTSPCKYQLSASSLAGAPLSPPLPPPSAFNGSFACPSRYSQDGWANAADGAVRHVGQLLRGARSQHGPCGGHVERQQHRSAVLPSRLGSAAGRRSDCVRATRRQSHRRC